jgi:predicted dehydrogenase
LASAKGLHLLVPYGWHHKPFVQRARRLLEDRAVGEIQYLLCHMASPIRSLLQGIPKEIDSVRGQSGRSLFAPEPQTWADPAIAGGGYGHAQVSHSSGMLFWLTGLRARTVFAMMSAPEARVDLYDAIAVRFSSGALGTVSGSGTVPRNGPRYQVDLRIFGNEGMVLLDCERARMELHRHDGTREVADVDPESGYYECSAPPNNFLDLILGITDINWTPGEAAMRSVELLDAAYRSAETGLSVEV